MTTSELLKLDNQICFPVYAASRLITRQYQPYLDKLGITYPQYLVLLILWEEDGISVNDITQKLILNTNTVTPLLKRMEALGIIKRTRSKADERVVQIGLTAKGTKMREKAASIPMHMAGCLMPQGMQIEDIIDLKEKLHRLIDFLQDKE